MSEFLRCVLRDEGDVVQRIGEGVVRGPVEGRWMVHTPGDYGDPVGFDTAEDANAWLEDWARKAEFAALKARLNRLERQVIVAMSEESLECRFHGKDFGFLGFERPDGPPRCDSCKRPWRRTQLLLAAGGTVPNA